MSLYLYVSIRFRSCACRPCEKKPIMYRLCFANYLESGTKSKGVEFRILRITVMQKCSTCDEQMGVSPNQRHTLKVYRHSFRKTRHILLVEFVRYNATLECWTLWEGTRPDTEPLFYVVKVTSIRKARKPQLYAAPTATESLFVWLVIRFLYIATATGSASTHNTIFASRSFGDKIINATPPMAVRSSSDPEITHSTNPVEVLLP